MSVAGWIIGGVFVLLTMFAVLAISRPFILLNGLAFGAAEKVASDIAFGTEPRQMLDVYAPSTARSAPVVLFFYGGRWHKGARQDYRFVGESLARHGIITVVADYRLYPDVRFPAFMEDAAAAAHWTYQNIGAYGGDPSQIYLMGHSAGAHIAMLLLSDQDWLGEKYGMHPSAFAGGIGISGPYDFLPMTDPVAIEVFSTAADQRVTQPVHFGEGPRPPLLLIHGREDTTVGAHNSLNLARHWDAQGNLAEFVTLDGVGHKTPVVALHPLLGGLAPVLPEIITFIHAE